MQFEYEFIACERWQIMNIIVAAAIRNFLQERTVCFHLRAGHSVCLYLLCVGRRELSISKFESIP